ncbi:hypothetical protein [Streptomyces sp. NPDC093071]
MNADDLRAATPGILAEPDISAVLRAATGTTLDDSIPEASRRFPEVGR